MSNSPRLRRLSNGSNGSYMSPVTTDGLVNYYEAEQERIINLLSRKLEQLRVEKIQLENALEAESESQVNRLNRELTALRRQQQQQQQAQNGSADPSTPSNQVGGSASAFDPYIPTTDVLLDALRKENETLRNRLVDIERDYLKVKRLNEVYREELIEHRSKAHMSIDNLVDPDAVNNIEISHRPPRRRPISMTGSPNSTVLALPSSSSSQRAPSSPIPMPLSSLGGLNSYPQHHPRQSYLNASSTTTSNSSSLTHSPISTDSPYTFSPTLGPVISCQPASYVSNASYATNLTTPQSVMSLQSNPPLPYPMAPPQHLSYPSVPPPSLSSSLGSPTIPFLGSSLSTSTGLPQPDALDLDRPLNQAIHHRANSITNRPRGSSLARVAETGSLKDLSESRAAGRARRESTDDWSHVGSASSSGPGSSSATGLINRSGSRSPATYHHHHSRHTSGTQVQGQGEIASPSIPSPSGSTTTAPIPIRAHFPVSRESTPVSK